MSKQKTRKRQRTGNTWYRVSTDTDDKTRLLNYNDLTTDQTSKHVFVLSPRGTDHVVYRQWYKPSKRLKSAAQSGLLLSFTSLSALIEQQQRARDSRGAIPPPVILVAVSEKKAETADQANEWIERSIELHNKNMDRIALGMGKAT